MLENIGKISKATSPKFSAAAKVLKELVEHYIKEEDGNVWFDEKQHFSREQRSAMNVKCEPSRRISKY